jgi:heat shock protein HslJ
MALTHLASLLVRVRRAAAAAITLVAALAGCATPGGPAILRPTPSGEYVVTEASVAGSSHAFVKGSEVRISFDDGKLGITAGCNHLFGDFEVDGDDLVVGQIGGTEMGCPQDLMEQDAWLVAFFDHTVTIGHDPMTLTSGETILTLTPRTQAHPDRALVGVAWVLDGVVQGDSVSSVPAGPDVVLRFESTDVAGVTGLCNGWGADVTAVDESITWRPHMRTLMACADDARNDLDTTVASLLTGRTAYEIEERTLRITRGDRGLVFVATD